MLYIALGLLGTMANNSQRTFISTICDPEPSIISSDILWQSSEYYAQHVLTKNENDVVGTYWLAPIEGGEFVMDLGCVGLVFGVELVNTVNCRNDGCDTPYSRDRATAAFKVYLGLAEAGPWAEVLSEELEDPRQDSLPLPLLTFTLPPTKARFIKFKLVSWYGNGGGLQYFTPLLPSLGQLVSYYKVSKTLYKHLFPSRWKDNRGLLLPSGHWYCALQTSGYCTRFHSGEHNQRISSNISGE